jgi:RNA polymerase sigma factor (sigma-70 family)
MANGSSPTATRTGVDPATRRIATNLYRQHHALLLGVAIKNSANRPDAEEALQDTFLIFLDRFEPTSDTPPLAWLTLTLKRHCWAIYKRRKNAPDRPRTGVLDQVADPNISPVEAAEAAEELADHRALLEILRPAERRALGLLAFGLSYQEIMDTTGWTYTKVNRSIRDGRARLRRKAAA